MPLTEQPGLNGPSARSPSPPDFVPFNPAHSDRPLAWHFEQQVPRRPDQPVLQAATHSVSYAELNAAANRLAHFILAGTRAGSAPVALLMPQGASALTAIVACLKAGRIYVALDPALPQARISVLLADAGSGLLLCDHDYLETARAAAGEHCVAVDVATIDYGSEENPDIPIAPDTVALITYTSGSTGWPKGVVHTHRSVVHQVQRAINDYGFASSDRVSWVRSPNILAIADTFMTLTIGAITYPFDVRREGMSALVRLFAERRITSGGMAATTFRQLAASLTGGGNFPSLRYFVTGGERLYPADVELFRKHFSPSSVFISTWGTTECGSMTNFGWDSQMPVYGPVLHSGRPMSGVEMMLRDDDGNPVPNGEPGEIVVKSLSLAAGYWQQPELTRERFVTGADGARVYLTGDLARVLPDGCLELLGRKDQQLKVRGFRVEPIEIEQALLAAPGVRQAVVLLRHDPPVEDRLVAYIVPSQSPPPTVTELRSSLAARLPNYMLPAAFVFVDAFPLTASGKVERTLLPAPGRERPALAAPFAPPRSPAEQSLARIWCEVLAIDAIGIEDPFLDLGGHSLQAVRIIARVLGEFRVELPLRSLFDAPTVSAMAALITTHQAQQLGAERLEELLRELEGQTPAPAR